MICMKRKKNLNKWRVARKWILMNPSWMIVEFEWHSYTIIFDINRHISAGEKKEYGIVCCIIRFACTCHNMSLCLSIHSVYFCCCSPLIVCLQLVFSDYHSVNSFIEEWTQHFFLRLLFKWGKAHLLLP